MLVELECNYCGYKWIKTSYTNKLTDSDRCHRCKDKSLKLRDLEYDKIDYYVGCPPFPPKNKPEDNEYWHF